MKFPRLGAAILLLVIMSMAAFTGFVPVAAVLALDHTVDDHMPFFENRYETDHFILKWTNKSRHSRDNISDPQIIKDTAEYLETAWAKYTDLFGRHPYTAPGRNKMEVVFWGSDCYGVSDPPDGPIQFGADAWVSNPAIRKPTSAHELFHKLQYAYGYRIGWNPRKPYQWFTEGTAAWSEAFVWGMVSRDCKVDTLFKDTEMDLYEADYTAMPFWIYFVQGNQENPDNHLMVKFFEKCEQVKDERLALNEVIKETYGSVDGFFKRFATERKNGFWSNACAIPYKCIRGPKGKDLVEEVKDFQKKWNRN
ncbi:MAG: hypothetical protein ABSG91_21520 [Syntrophobacteraceae bacterium]|jgi:hypothetical protein